MNVDAAVADVTDEPRTALKWVEASAKDRGDLGLANDAHYRLRVLESDGYSWPWHALDLVFYRWVAGYLVRPLRPLFTLLALVLLVFVMRSAWRNLRGGASNRGGRSERAGHRSVGHTIARGGNELLDTFTAVWSRKMDQQASEWALFGRRVEALVYRLLIVCALLGLANSNPTLRQMLDALL